MQNKKDFNTTVTPLWPTKSGGFYMGNLVVNDEMLAALKTVTKGSQLVIKALPADRRKHEYSPHAYLEVVTPAKVAEIMSTRSKYNLP